MTTHDEQIAEHRGGHSRDGVMCCDTCGDRWPCRENLARANERLQRAGGLEYERHRAECAEIEADYRRRWARHERRIVLPLLVLAALEAGLLLGIWWMR